MTALLWLAGALLLGIAEVLSLDLFFLMLGLSALGGSAAAAAGLNTTGQVVIFAILAIILLFIARPLLKAHLLSAIPHEPTNADALIGKPSRVLEDVSVLDGRVRIEGEVWSARTEDEEVCPAESVVYVHRIDGATVIVSANRP